MYCGQCGKRVLDTMLFCPFCGSPIVIPDQDAEESKAPAPAPKVEQVDSIPELPPEEGAPAAGEEEFEPLLFEEKDESATPAESAEPAESAHPVSLFDALSEKADEPERSPVTARAEQKESPTSHRQRPSGGGVRRPDNTYIPVKNVNVDDMFMDDTHPEREDDYDAYDEIEDAFDERFPFEEPERGGFLQRHIRGVVGVVLLVMLLSIFLIWLMMPSGQRLLAEANLAWRADVYEELGYDAYEADQFHQAAVFFERALARDTKNYEYAHSAMVAYYNAEELDSALSMLKKCIEIDPDSAEPYHELLILYPSAENRPWEVQELLRQGYEKTGDAALNVAE